MSDSQAPPPPAGRGKEGGGAMEVDLRRGEQCALAANVAGPIASVSSHLDPWPHYAMSAVCFGAALNRFVRAGSPPHAAAAAGFSLLYLLAGNTIFHGAPRVGYDLASATSLGLLAYALPGARAAGDAYSVGLAALGGMSSLANGIKSYQMRTGRPLELHERV